MFAGAIYSLRGFADARSDISEYGPLIGRTCDAPRKRTPFSASPSARRNMATPTHHPYPPKARNVPDAAFSRSWVGRWWVE